MVLERLRFNLRVIQQHIDKNEFEEPVYPDESYTLFNIERGKLKRINDVAAAVLSLCDGELTVSSIAQRLAAEYRAPAATVEHNCLELLQSLNDDGYIDF